MTALFTIRHIQVKIVEIDVFWFAVTKILQACDKLRDNNLLELGVKLEDLEGN